MIIWLEPAVVYPVVVWCGGKAADDSRAVDGDIVRCCIGVIWSKSSHDMYW